MTDDASGRDLGAPWLHIDDVDQTDVLVLSNML